MSDMNGYLKVFTTFILLMILALKVSSKQILENGGFKRQANTNVDPTKTVVSGDGIVDIETNKTYTILVTAKDSSGANISVGGDLFYARISNQCTITSQVLCTENSGAVQTLSTVTEDLMKDNQNGTYSFNYSQSTSGKVSICVILRNTGIVNGYFYNTQRISSTPDFSNSSSKIDFKWGDKLNYKSAEFKTYLRPSVTGKFNFSVYYEDGATIQLNGFNYTNQFCNQVTETKNFEVNLTANTDNYLYILYCKYGISANLSMTWSNSSYTNGIAIPSENFVWPQFVGNSPYTINIIQNKQSCSDCDGTTAEILGFISYGVIVISVVLVIVVSLLSFSSPNGIWVMLGAYRMMMFVPFIGATLSSELIDYLSRLSFILFSFSFIPTNQAAGLKEIFNFFDTSQSNEMMVKLKLKYSSTLINHFNLFLIVFGICIIHTAFLTTSLLCRKKVNCCTKLTDYILKFKIYGVYIRIYMEACISILLNSMMEISQSNQNSPSKIVSLCISILFSIFCVALITSGFVNWNKIFNSSYTPNYFGEMFKSIKITKPAALYSCYFLLRRLLCAIFVAVFTFAPMISNIICYLLAQVSCLIYLVIAKPQLQIKDNIVEIINEVVYVFICTSLLYFNEADRWVKWVSIAEICSLIGCSCISLIVTLIFCIKSRCSKKPNIKLTPVLHNVSSVTPKEIFKINSNYASNLSKNESNIEEQKEEYKEKFSKESIDSKKKQRSKMFAFKNSNPQFNNIADESSIKF